MDNNINNISDLFLNTISEFYEYDKKSKTFGIDTELYHSEIHMVACIKENENLHISEAARKLSITRGAASQTIKRLERKGVVIKEEDINNNSKLILKLTDKGETAYKNHQKDHDKYNTIIEKILKNADAAEIAFLNDFLMKFKNYLK